MDTSAREMVKICGGVPLAITILGGILATKHEIKEWESIGLGGGQKGNEGATSVLELSCEDLPNNLKSCFLYFSQYLEDEEINTTEIIQKWIGEGFVKWSTDETMENVGRKHLNELVRRRLIQVGKRSHTGRVKTYRMHELVWEFCVSKAKEEGFVHSLKLEYGSKLTTLEKIKAARLCIFSGERSSCYKVSGSMVSSLLQLASQPVSVRFQDDLDKEEGEAGVLIVKKLKLVKVLKLPSMIWTLLDDSAREQIGNLVNLTFLNLEVPMLPKTIGNLRCLQTLNLERCDAYLTIPDSVWGMEQLRHLYLPSDGSFCESSKQPVGNLRNLQTLVNFPPDNFDLQQNLVKFSNVRKLVIIRRWEEMGKILRSQEIMFQCMQSLTFTYFSRGKVDLEAVTGGCPYLYRLLIRGWIKFPASCSTIWPSNLSKLVLEDTHLDQSQLGTLAKLKSLKVMFLQWNAFTGKEMVFHKNDFPQLHHLLVEELKDLETWAVHEGGLPNLFCLEINFCSNLKSIGDGSRFLKQLKELKVKHMPYRFRKRLEQGGEDWEGFSHVPSISLSEIY